MDGTIRTSIKSIFEFRGSAVGTVISFLTRQQMTLLFQVCSATKAAIQYLLIYSANMALHRFQKLDIEIEILYIV